jgi:hypothetical protein
LSEQQQHLDRVEAKIAEVVLAFLSNKSNGDQFHLQDLQEYVARTCPVSPDSPSRILRELRRKGRIDYNVVSRHDSLYEFMGFVGSDRESLQTRLAKLGFASVLEYENSEHWKQFKVKYYSVHERKCSITGRTDNVDLHHLTYERLGEERFEDVIPLWRPLHECIHAELLQRGISLSRAHEVVRAVYATLSQPS